MRALQTCALVIAAAALVGAGAWLRSCTGPDVARLAAARDSLAGAVFALRLRDHIRSSQDSARAAAAASLEDRGRRALAEGRARGADAQLLLDSIARLLQHAALSKDSGRTLVTGILPLLGQLDSAHAGERRACVAAFSACDSALAIERARVAVRDSGIAEREQLLAGYQVQLDQAIRAARPRPLWRSLVTAGSCAIAGAGAVKHNTALELTGGAGCAAGIVFR